MYSLTIKVVWIINNFLISYSYFVLERAEGSFTHRFNGGSADVLAEHFNLSERKDGVGVENSLEFRYHATVR